MSFRSFRERFFTPCAEGPFSISLHDFTKSRFFLVGLVSLLGLPVQISSMESLKVYDFEGPLPVLSCPSMSVLLSLDELPCVRLSYFGFFFQKG